MEAVVLTHTEGVGGRAPASWPDCWPGDLSASGLRSLVGAGPTRSRRWDPRPPLLQQLPPPLGVSSFFLETSRNKYGTGGGGVLPCVQAHGEHVRCTCVASQGGCRAD